MKLRYVLLSLCCISPILPHEVDDFALGVLLTLEGIEKATANKLANEAAPFKAYNNIYATLINPKTADDIRTALLKNKDVLLKLPDAAQAINNDINIINNFVKNPETFIDTNDYFAHYLAVISNNDTQEIKNFIKKDVLEAIEKGKFTQHLDYKKHLTEFIKNQGDKINNSDNRTKIKNEINSKKNLITNTEMLIKNLKNIKFNESDKEKLYTKLIALSGNKIDKNKLEVAFNEEIEKEETLEKTLLTKKWFDKIQKIDLNNFPTKEYNEVLLALTDDTYGQENRKKFLTLLNTYEIPFSEIITTIKDQIGNLEELLYKKLNDKNDKEKKLKEILRKNEKLRTLFINHEDILDDIKTSKALDYITNDDVTEQSNVINKLMSFNFADKKSVKTIIKNTPEQLTTPKYQLYYLLPKNKDLRDNLIDDNSTLGQTLRKLPYDNMKKAVGIILDNLTSIPYIINNNGRFTQKELSIAINNKDMLATFKRYVSIIDILKNQYENINQFINTNKDNTKHLKDLIKKANDSGLNKTDIESLNLLEKKLNTKNLQKFWDELPKNNDLKNAFSKNPLILAHIADYCDDNLCSQPIKNIDTAKQKDLITALENPDNELVENLELAKSKSSIFELINDFLGW